MNSSPFQAPMQPWPGLEQVARQMHLPKRSLDLFYYETGSPQYPTLCLLHGLGDEADTWRRLIQLLSANWRVIAPDLPGFGRSGLSARPLTAPFFQEVLFEWLAEIGVSRLALMGHSMGAMIAHSIALDHPEVVDRLILLSGSLLAQAARLDLSLLMFLVPGLGEWQYTRLRRDPQAAYRSLELYYQDLSSLPEEDRSFLYNRVNQRVWSDRQRWAFLSALRGMVSWVPARQRGLPALLAACKTPTLVIWGEQDRVNSVAGGQALVQLQPSARLVVLPGAGHNLQQEHPTPILQALAEMFPNPT